MGAGSVRRHPSAGGRRFRGLAPCQAGAVLPRLGRSHPRRQDRRLGLLGTDGIFVRLRRFPRRRSRPRQGGNFLLPARQRGNLATWRRALVRLGSAAGRDCRGPCRDRRGADRRHREDDGRDGARHRVRQLRTHRAGRRAAPLGKRARLPACPARGRIENRTGGGDGARSCPRRGRYARPRPSPPRRSRSGRALAPWARSHACARSRPRRRGERVALGPRARTGARATGRAGRLGPRTLGDCRRRAAAMLGAILVLVFALAQGLFWAG